MQSNDCLMYADSAAVLPSVFPWASFRAGIPCSDPSFGAFSLSRIPDYSVQIRADFKVILKNNTIFVWKFKIYDHSCPNSY